jgi:hypothetical protein
MAGASGDNLANSFNQNKWPAWNELRAAHVLPAALAITGSHHVCHVMKWIGLPAGRTYGDSRVLPAVSERPGMMETWRGI